MSEAELLTFSDYSLHFANGVTLPFGPRQYGYELRRGVWCDPHLHTSAPCHGPRAHPATPPTLARTVLRTPQPSPTPSPPLQVPRHL